MPPRRGAVRSITSVADVLFECVARKIRLVEIPGEMTLASEVSILQVGALQPRSSYYVETCASKKILDESFADAQPLSSIFD